MTSDESALWQKLQAFRFTDPAALVTFEDKLLRQTGWTSTAADEAIEEYRRFLFLAARSGHPVSPSPVVDEVWHLHLLYTHNYWQTLCKDVLGFDLHHEPATGAAGEKGKFADWYTLTRHSYEKFFGPPPRRHLA